MIPYTARVTQLESILLDKVIEFRLFSNDIVDLLPTVVLGDFIQVIGSGYTPIPVTPDLWTISLGPVIGEAPEIEWVFEDTIEGSGSIYGFYCVNTNDNSLMGADKFYAPVTPVNGTIIRLVPRYSAS